MSYFRQNCVKRQIVFIGFDDIFCKKLINVDKFDKLVIILSKKLASRHQTVGVADWADLIANAMMICHFWHILAKNVCLALTLGWGGLLKIEPSLGMEKCFLAVMGRLYKTLKRVDHATLFNLFNVY